MLSTCKRYGWSHMDIKVDTVTYRRRCIRCGKRFKFTSKGIGPSLICTECADILLGIIWGGTVTGRDKFGNVVVEVTNGVD